MKKTRFIDITQLGKPNKPKRPIEFIYSIEQQGQNVEYTNRKPSEFPTVIMKEIPNHLAKSTYKKYDFFIAISKYKGFHLFLGHVNDGFIEE